MTLLDITEMFSTDEKCRELLKRLRWPDDVKCIRCGSIAVPLATAKELFYCKACDYQFSVTAGTIFNDSHLSLTKWFMVTLLLCEARKGISANQIKRTVGMSYKTAWYLCHRIRAAMSEAQQKKLSGTIEVDETYIGGKQRCHARQLKNKAAVIGIRERDGRLHFIHAHEVNQESVYNIIAANVDKTVDVIMTDESKLYNFKLTQYRKAKHQSLNHSAGEYVRGDIHTNTIESAFSLFKRGIVGSWHKVSVKHLSAYLQEMTFRFNRRKNHDLFLDTLRHMVTAPVLTFEKLTA